MNQPLKCAAVAGTLLLAVNPKAATPSAPLHESTPHPRRGHAVACTRSPAVPRAPQFSLSPGHTGDDTCAIQAAVDAALKVSLDGKFVITAPIELPAGTTVEGVSGTTEITQQAEADVFRVTGNLDRSNDSVTFVDSVHVTGLHFVGHRDDFAALRVSLGRHITFDHNTADRIGLVTVTVDPHGSVQRGNPRPFNPVSFDVTITDNRGTGTYCYSGSDSRENAILLSSVDSASVARNNISFYSNGIEWWGGNADPDRSKGGEGFLDENGDAVFNEMLARNIHIVADTIMNTKNGIWGSMGDAITVDGNQVYYCVDVCLDAEGSSNVHFSHNQAGYARIGSVLSVFFYSTDVTFEFNDVFQTGMGPGMQTHAAGGKDYCVLFASHNPQSYQANIRIYLQNNTFRFDAGPFATCPVGFVLKESSRYFEFDANTLHDVVLDLRPKYNGAVFVGYNSLTFSRSTAGLAAVSVAHNYGRKADVSDAITADVVHAGSRHQVDIRNNNISSPGVPQDTAAGIMVSEGDPSETSLDEVGKDESTWIHLNGIGDFSRSIFAEWNGKVHYCLTHNVPTGTVTVFERPIPNVTPQPVQCH